MTAATGDPATPEPLDPDSVVALAREAATIVHGAQPVERKLDWACRAATERLHADWCAFGNPAEAAAACARRRASRSTTSNRSPTC